MKYRYYIGLQLPPKVSDQIRLLQRRLHDPIETIEPLEPHITLLPPPAVEAIDPQNLALHAKAAAKATWPLPLHLTSVSTFGGHAVAFLVESDGIYELQQQLVNLLPFAADVTYYPQPAFVPHVTVVQAIRGKTLPIKLSDRYKREAERLLPITCNATHLTLFEWTGPRSYEAKPI